MVTFRDKPILFRANIWVLSVSAKLVDFISLSSVGVDKTLLHSSRMAQESTTVQVKTVTLQLC